jgi:muramoyltetrapeptide carboxypeptidase
MIRPAFLQYGDKIGIISTARKITLEELQAAITCFTSWGLEVVLGDNLFKVHHQFAGSDMERSEDLQSMLDNEEIKAVVCARGGYGTVRVIDRIDFSRFQKKPKWICGFSDVTVLHSHIHQHFGIQTIHSLMPVNLKTTECNSEAASSLKNALFGEPLSYDYPSHMLNRTGQAIGEIVGGNLSILYSLLGSSSDINTAGKILFIEDLDEYLYHIDRMMMNLKRNGKLDNLKALVVGGMSDMYDNSIAFGRTAVEIVKEAVDEYNYPVSFNFPAGHIQDNRAFYLGSKVELTVETSRSALKF